MSFEVDRDGILHVSAHDKAAKKSQSVTITGDKGRLSKEEIEEKVKEVAEFAEEDKRSMEKVDSRNRLESYLHNAKRSVSDKEILADRVDPEERESVEGAVDAALEWLNRNQDVDTMMRRGERLKQFMTDCQASV